MAEDRAYRVQISYDPNDKSFDAHAPELDLSANASSRADAIELLEQAIDERMLAAAEGDALPDPIDLLEVGDTLEIILAPELQRDLNFYAQRAKMDAQALATQLISYGVGKLAGKYQVDAPEKTADSMPKDRGENRRQGGRRRGRRDNPRKDIDDQAHFLEYVRDLETGKGSGRRGR